MPTYGLQFSNIYGRIKDYANINNVTNADTKAKAAANDALRLIASLRNWEILKRESSVTPVASTQSYAIITGTTDFDHIISCWYLSNGQEIPIDVLDDSEWKEKSENTLEGTPQFCRVTIADGTLKIQFSPIPSASFVAQYTTIKFDYVKKPAELSGDTDIPNIPDTSQQMAIVYLAVSDLLAKQGDLNGMAAYEIKGNRLLNLAHKIDDKKKGSVARIGRPMIAINSVRGNRAGDY
jgi:hypothetical protein